jgi:hypothetical protein
MHAYQTPRSSRGLGTPWPPCCSMWGRSWRWPRRCAPAGAEWCGGRCRVDAGGCRRHDERYGRMCFVRPVQRTATPLALLMTLGSLWWRRMRPAGESTGRVRAGTRRPTPCLGGMRVFPSQRMGQVDLAMPPRPDRKALILGSAGTRSLRDRMPWKRTNRTIQSASKRSVCMVVTEHLAHLAH